MDQAVDVLRVSVCAINKAQVRTLFYLVVQDQLALRVRQIESMLDDIVAELIFEQVGETHLVGIMII